MADYYAILTHIGEAKLANALALGEPLQITHLAVGDGAGSGAQGTPLPDPAQTALVSERRRAPLNTLTTDPANQNVLIAEQVIPEDVGGWWIREMGLFDADGDMIAVCNTPPTYKPVLASGSGRTQVVRMQLIVTDTSAVTLRVDPAVVLATRKYVDDQRASHEQSRAHPAATTEAQGMIELATAAETAEGEDQSRAVPPAHLAALFPYRGVQVYDTPGVHTWHVPPGVTRAWVTVIGAGGGGGHHINVGGGGGGGGAIAEKLVDLTNVAEVTVTVGAGGSGQTEDAAAQPGGTSSFGAYCSAPGGPAANGYAGATTLVIGIGGDINSGLGAGSHASTNVDGTRISGNGAVGVGGRIGGDLSGQDGRVPGAGGGGGTGTGNGGRGADGIVIIRW